MTHIKVWVFIILYPTHTYTYNRNYICNVSLMRSVCAKEPDCVSEKMGDAMGVSKCVFLLFMFSGVPVECAEIISNHIIQEPLYCMSCVHRGIHNNE